MYPKAYPFSQEQLDLLISDEVLDAIVERLGPEEGPPVRDEILFRAGQARPALGHFPIKFEQYTQFVVAGLRDAGHADLASVLESRR